MTQRVPGADEPKAAWRAFAATIDRSDVSDAVAAQLTAWPPMHGVVAGYLARPDEIDVTAAFDTARCRTLVPRTEPGDRLTLHALEPERLVRHRFGFDEPEASSVPVSLDDVDVALVPGLVFDRAGYRIGYGRGMYDRLLGELPVGVVRVGITADALVAQQIPTAAHDRRVDWLATESGIVRTGGPLSASSELVVARAIERGIAPAMIRFPEGTKTSQDAADAVGSELGAIAKSVLFVVDDRPVLVICSGDHRISEAKLAAHFDAGRARIASLDTVRTVTGFVAGGTPAVGLASDIEVIADVTLARYRWVWSAGGTPDTVYPVALDRLVAASGARWVDVSERG